MSVERLTSRSNMYSGVSGTGLTPPIPPRESSLPPVKGFKSAPEVKKKKVKKTESCKGKEPTNKIGKESPLMVGFTKEMQAEKISGSKESLSMTAPASQELTLLEFVKSYSRQFPQRIRVINGFCGNSNRLTISANDMYNIHLLKHVRVARVKDMIGTDYSVPVNSSIEFGLVFDPTEDSRVSQQAMSGFNLRVPDIFSLPFLPKLLCCVSGWSSSDGSISLEENETLVIKGVQKSRMKKKSMKVFSVIKKKELLVPEHCMALFSTRPRLVKMTVADIIENVPDPFPCPATVYLGDNLYHNPTTAALIQDMSDRFLSDVVKITGVVTESSLIASALYPEGFPMDEYSEEQIDEFVDIPLEGELLNIEVALVETAETKIYDDTVAIYEKFDQAKLKCMKEMTSSQASAAQSLFYASVKEGWEKHGVELDEPTAAYVSMTLNHPTTIEPPVEGKEVSTEVSKASDDDSDGYESIYHEIQGEGLKPVFGNSNAKKSAKEDKRSPSGSLRGDKQSPSGSQRGDKMQLPGFLMKKPKESTSEAPAPPPPPPLPPPSHDSSPPPHPSSPLPALPHQGNPYQAIPSPCSSPSPFSSPSQLHLQERFKQKLPSPDITPPPSRVVERLPKMGTMPRLRKSTESSFKEETEPKIRALEKRVEKMETMIDLLERASRKEQEEMGGQIKQLTQRMEELESSAIGVAGTSRTLGAEPSEEQSEDEREMNRQTLSKLSLQQVLSILDNMELSKYRSTFQDEQLTGDIMLELTDEILRDELEVHSKIHRIRLMKLVTGTHSPMQYHNPGQK